MLRRMRGLAALSILVVGGAALGAERPEIAPGAEYAAASAALSQAGYKAVRQPDGRPVCTARKGMCEAYPELRDCGPGDSPVCLFQWTSADGRTTTYVEASGPNPKALKVTRSYEVASGGNPYPLGTSGL